MTETVYLSLGSNKGDRLLCLKDTLCHVELQVGCVTMRSSIYSSAPWGDHQQGAVFLNQVIGVITPLSPSSLLKTLLAIELRLGRDQTNRQMPRPIDIDILLYGNRVICTPDLSVPHPLIALRRFVLAPFAEIAPNVIHPLHGVSISQLLTACVDPLYVAMYSPTKG